MRIVVTGGSGKAGRWVVRDLREHGHYVTNVDTRHDGSEHGLCLLADLADYGQTAEALTGYDAVVHLAAIPAPGLRPPADTFRNNVLSTYNVFAAAEANGVGRVVWASSETVLGLPFDTPPAFAPIDETIEPRPETSYALSKLAGETLATQFNRRTGIPIVGLRISNIMEPDDYARFPSYWDDATLRKWNLWGYVDCRDVAQACRLGLEADVTGAEVCIVAADDTVMTRPSADLMAEVFPDVPLTREVSGRETLLSIDRARLVLGYAPQHRWADHVAAPVSEEAAESVDVHDNPAEHRYEAWLDGELAGFSEYEPHDGWLVFTHTEVFPAFEGKGVGSQLARIALDDVRARGLGLTPQCPFINAYIRRHPAYADMVVGIRGTPVPRRGTDPRDPGGER